MWLVLLNLIISQAISIPIAQFSNNIWLSSVFLIIATLASGIGTYIYLHYIWIHKKRISSRTLIYYFIDIYIGLQLGLSALGLSIYLISSGSTFINITAGKTIYEIFWEFIFTIAVGTFNGVGFGQVFPLSIVASLWPVLCTWTGYFYRIVASIILIYRLSNRYRSKPPIINEK